MVSTYTHASLHSHKGMRATKGMYVFCTASLNTKTITADNCVFLLEFKQCRQNAVMAYTTNGRLFMTNEQPCEA